MHRILSRHPILPVIALAVLYFLSARLGYALTFSGIYASPVWPPAGIALAAVWLFGARIWPGIFLGVFFTELTAFLPCPVSDLPYRIFAALLIAGGNSLEAVAGYYIIRRFADSNAVFHRVKHALVFFAAAFSCAAIGAAVGVLAISANGLIPPDAAQAAWFTWWIGDAAGLILLTPLILCLMKKCPPEPAGVLNRFVETIVVFGAFIVIAVHLFSGGGPLFVDVPPYLLFPLTFWIVIRLGFRAALISVVTVSVIAIWGTINGYGPFILSPPRPADSLLLLQIFIVTVTVTAILMGSTTAERNRSQAKLARHQAILEEKVAERTHALRAANTRLQSEIDRGNRALEELRESRAAHRETRERYRTVVEDQTELICRFLPDGTLTFVNPAYARYFGKTVESLIGGNWLNFLPEPERESVREHLRRFTPDAPVKSYTHEVIHTDRETGWQEWTDHAFFDENGEVREIQSVGRDITRQKRMEERLKQSEERLSMALQGANDGLWDWNLTTGEVYYSDRRLAMLGYAPGELPATVDSWRKIIHPDDVTWVTADLDEHLRGEKPFYETEHRCKTKSGEYKWILDRGRVVTRDASGAPMRMVGTHTDITERKEQEIRFRELQTRYRMVFNATPVLIGVSAVADGRFIEVNDSFFNTLGFSATEVLGKTSVEIGIWSAEERQRMINRFMKEGRIRNMELTIHRKDGTPLSMLAYGESISFTGEPCLLVVAVDITDRKRLEEDLKATKEAAEAANRAKSEFLANMSHEIRTPLNGVIGMADILLHTDLNPEQREYCDTIVASARSLLVIINDILDLSKIEAGRLTLERISFDLRDLVEDVATLHSPHAWEKNIEMIVDYAPRAPTHFWGDPFRFRQILTNLVGNAVKFTQSGHVRIRVDADRNPADSARISVSVADTGPGITEAQRAVIFDKFTQADSTTTRKFGGTGLGLAICKQLIQLMGGSIGVDATPGEGAVFRLSVRLPLADPHPAPAPPAEIRKMRILVVDDPDIHRSVLTALLSAWGTDVETADRGMTALETLHRASAEGKSFNAVIIKQNPPDLSAVKWARRIHAADTLKKVRLLLWAGPNERPSLPELRQTGFAGRISRPLRAGELLDTLLQTIDVTGAPIASEDKETAGFHPDSSHRKIQNPKTNCAGVLLVEDSDTNRKVAVKALEKLGCDVSVAENGARAVEKTSRRRFDMIFMDCQMPVMDGFEATRRIRAAEPAGERIPIVAMTADVMEGVREKCAAAGMDDYLSKPVTIAAIREVLVRFCPACGPPAAGEKPIDALIAAGDETTLQRIRTILEKTMPAIRIRRAKNITETFLSLGIAPPDWVILDVDLPHLDLSALMEYTGKTPSLSHIHWIWIGRPPASAKRQAVAGILEKPFSGDRFQKLLYALKDHPETPGSANTGPAEETTPILDITQLPRLVEGDQEAIDEIITACGEELPAALSTIQRAVEMEDAETLARTAHTIKGTAANVGALRLRKLAIETEAAGKSEDFKTAGRLLNQLDAAVTELMNALMQTDWTFLVRHDGKNRADESVDRRR